MFVATWKTVLFGLTEIEQLAEGVNEKPIPLTVQLAEVPRLIFADASACAAF